MSGFFVFSDDEILGRKHIVLNKITAYGFVITEMNGENGCPSRAQVWVETINASHNKNVTYAEAVDIISQLDDCLYKFKE